MEIRCLFRILLRYWWLLVIPVGIAAVLAVPDLLNRTATSGGYSASLSYTAFQNPEALPRPAGDFQDLWLSSELAVDALTDWVRGSSFRDELVLEAANAGYAIDPAQLAIAADNERAVGQLFLSYPEENTLNAALDAAQIVLQTRTAEFFPQLGGSDADVRFLNVSPAAAAPPSLPNRFSPLLRVGIGLLAGLGLIFLAHYLDARIRRRSEVEAAGLAVLATIPGQ